MKLLPRSLFGRTMLVLVAALMLAEITSQVLNIFDRGSGVYRLGAQQMALRIAQATRILNRLPPAQREAVIEEMNGPSFNVGLSGTAVELGKGFAEHDRYEQALSSLITYYLRAERNVSVEITRLGQARRPRNYEAIDTNAIEQWIARHFYFLLPSTYSVVVQIKLDDANNVVFFARIPQEPLSRLEPLLLKVLLMLAIFTALGFFAVRTVTRSLQLLARAAGQVGDNLEGAPVAEDGPSEVRTVIRAFNQMRQRLRGYVQERAQMLGAISHDLKTPITRLRLRVEQIADTELHAKILHDLDEMEATAGSTLEFFKSLGNEQQRQSLDVDALVASLCEDRSDTGRDVSVEGHSSRPYNAHPRALRRCLDNLVENALRYGTRARISIKDDDALLCIVVRDDGPGIPEADLERVFEPYFRLEQSRNRDSGGTGLGLAIARNIARWHGGDIYLSNALNGKGLVAELVLPRSQSSRDGKILANARQA